MRLAAERLIRGEVTDRFVFNRATYGYTLEVSALGRRFIFDFPTRKQNGRYNPQPNRRDVPRYEGDR